MTSTKMASTQTIKAAQIKYGGGIESFLWAKHPLRDPGEHEVRIRVRAVSLNYRDLVIASGHYPLTHSRPLIPVSDGAGTVDAVGSGVTRVRVGDRVSGTRRGGPWGRRNKRGAVADACPAWPAGGNPSGGR